MRSDTKGWRFPFITAWARDEGRVHTTVCLLFVAANVGLVVVIGVRDGYPIYAISLPAGTALLLLLALLIHSRQNSARLTRSRPTPPKEGFDTATANSSSRLPNSEHTKSDHPATNESTSSLNGLRQQSVSNIAREYVRLIDTQPEEYRDLVEEADREIRTGEGESSAALILNEVLGISGPEHTPEERRKALTYASHGVLEVFRTLGPPPPGIQVLPPGEMPDGGGGGVSDPVLDAGWGGRRG
ncbi:hypothetical protein GCM10010424_06340 [Streptomyces lienomycini]